MFLTSVAWTNIYLYTDQYNEEYYNMATLLMGLTDREEILEFLYGNGSNLNKQMTKF